jgi:hypothetical protein
MAGVNRPLLLDVRAPICAFLQLCFFTRRYFVSKHRRSAPFCAKVGDFRFRTVAQKWRTSIGDELVRIRIIVAPSFCETDHFIACKNFRASPNRA